MKDQDPWTGNFSQPFTNTGRWTENFMPSALLEITVLFLPQSGYVTFKNKNKTKLESQPMKDKSGLNNR